MIGCRTVKLKITKIKRSVMLKSRRNATRVLFVGFHKKKQENELF